MHTSADAKHRVEIATEELTKTITGRYFLTFFTVHFSGGCL